MPKGGLKSESTEGFSNLPKLVPKTFLVLFNAVHSVDKMTNVYLFVFTGLIYLDGLQIDFGNIMNILYFENILNLKYKKYNSYSIIDLNFIRTLLQIGNMLNH